MIYAAGAGQGADATATKPKVAPVRRSGGYHPLTVDGLPLDKPPYSTISAIDLDTGRSSGRSPMGTRPTPSATIRR